MLGMAPAQARALSILRRNRRISVFPRNINDIEIGLGPSVTGSSCSFASLSSSGVAHLRKEVATANNGYDREAHAYT